MASKVEKGRPISFGEYMRIQCRYMKMVASKKNITVIEAVIESSADFRARIIAKHGTIVMEYCRDNEVQHGDAEDARNGKSDDKQ